MFLVIEFGVIVLFEDVVSFFLGVVFRVSLVCGWMFVIFIGFWALFVRLVVVVIVREFLWSFRFIFFFYFWFSWIFFILLRLLCVGGRFRFFGRVRFFGFECLFVG